MKSNWWKFLGIGLLIYAVVVGVSIPLKPGVLRIDSLTMGANGNSAVQITHGEKHTFRIEGYNTNYESSQTSGWLKLDSIGTISATSIRPLSNQVLEMDIEIPSYFPLRDTFQSLTLVLHNKQDGPSILPDAVFVNTAGANSSNLDDWLQNALVGLSDKPGMQYPFRSVLNETIRNTFYHIPLWFSMFILLMISLFYSVRYLMKNNLKDDIIGSSLVNVAILFGVLGIITGSIWARFTWGTFWTTDVKLNMSTVAMLIYIASLILRSSINDIDRRAKLSASYNIFAFMALIPLVFVIPRLTDSLHPGNGGNPALGGEDMENTLRMVFYPAIIGFTLLGLWLSSIRIRYELLKDKWMTKD